MQRSTIVVIEVMVKDVKIFENIFIGLKKDLFGCFRIKKICDNDNETGLKRGRRNRNVNL